MADFFLFRVRNPNTREARFKGARIDDPALHFKGRSTCDRGVSEAQYLHDPDGNGVELCWDRPQEAGPRTPQGGLAMFTRRPDLHGLLKEVGSRSPAPKVDEGPQDL